MPDRPADRLSPLSLAFLAVVFAPLVVTVVEGTIPVGGGRDEFPGLPRGAGDVVRLPGFLRAAYNAHFGLKESLVRAHGLLKYEGLGVSPDPSLVALGADGWLFLNDVSMDEYRHLDPFDAEDLGAWADRLEREAATCRAAGAVHLFLVAPDKHTIYGEGRIPDAYRRRPGPSRLDQLLETVEAEGREVRVLDLRPALREADRRLGTLWYETDSHWNAAGAAVAAREILRSLAEQGVPTAPVTIAPRPDRAVRVDGGDEARLIGLADVIHQRDRRPDVRVGGRAVDLGLGRAPGGTVETNGAPPRFEHADPDAPATAPVILYVHDSTGVAVRPVLAAASRRLVAVWDDAFDPALLDEVEPDVVIHQIIERRLHDMDPDALRAP